MAIMKKKNAFLALCLSAVLVLTGCASTTKNEEPTVDIELIELQQSDFRGGAVRTFALKSKVLNIMETMKGNNAIIRQDSPNSYWTSSGYQDFVATFLTAPIINDTQWFNEEETDFPTIINQMLTTQSSFTKQNDDGTYSASVNINVYRNEKDDYTITGTSATIGNDSAYSGTLEYRILYDCDKDWNKAIAKVDLNTATLSNYTNQMFEYARLSNDVFAIQTANERLLMVLDPVEQDTDLRVRTVKEFYYSRLTGGQRTTFEPYEPVEELDEDGRVITENRQMNSLMAKYPLLNEKGDVASQYGENDSIFFNKDIYSLNSSWVFEDGALQQAIVFKDGTLVVTTYNKLTTKYERFIYSINAINQTLIAEIEKMVNIEGLVGYVDVATSDGNTTEPDNSNDKTTSDNTSNTNSNDSASDNSEKSDTSNENSTASDTSSDTAEEGNTNSELSESGG